MSEGGAASAPPTLQVRESLERIEVDLPAYLPSRAAALGAIAAALSAAYWMTFPEVREDAPRAMLGGATGLALTLGLLSADRRLLAGLGRLLRALSGLLAVLLALWMMGSLMGAMFMEFRPFMLGITAAMVWVLLLGLTRVRPTLALDGAKLEIRAGGRRRTLPLEEIGRIERDPGWRGRARIDGAVVPELSGLSGAEWGWLAALIGEQIQRRKLALAEQGHDLAAPPAGLAEVRVLAP